MHPDLSDWGQRLAALPEFEAPAAGWRGVLEARQDREARLDRRWPMALAAAVLVATAGLTWWLQSAAPVAATARAENERLEAILASLPERHAMRGSTAFTVAELEDRLASLDDRLSLVSLQPNAPERVEALWRERVDVMHTLVQVRYADAVGSY